MLTPADILPRWREWHLDEGSEPHLSGQLPGGLTNRNFRIQCGRHNLVLRINHPDAALLDLHRDSELQIHQAMAAAGLTPAVRYCDPAHRFWLRDYLNGTTPEINSQTLNAMASTLHRVHATDIRGLPLPVLSFRNKAEHYLNNARVSEDKRSRLHARIDAAALRLPDGDCLCHMDPLPANWLMETGGRLWLIDWEYAALAHPLLDFAAVWLHLPEPLQAEWLELTGNTDADQWQGALQQLQLLEELWYLANPASA